MDKTTFLYLAGGAMVLVLLIAIIAITKTSKTVTTTQTKKIPTKISHFYQR